jgi:hypothetical protein
MLLGNLAYNFVNAISSPGDVLIGATFAATAANLVAAISGGTGSSSTYIKTSTTPNNLTGVVGASGNITFTAAVGGLAGNSLITSYSSAGTSAGTFANGTLTGGVQTGGASGSIVFYPSPATYNPGAVTAGDSLNITSFGYGMNYWHDNFIDAVGSALNGTDIWAISTAFPLGATGFQTAGHQGSGGCGLPTNLVNNVNLVTGALITSLSAATPGC